MATKRSASTRVSRRAAKPPLVPTPRATRPVQPAAATPPGGDAPSRRSPTSLATGAAALTPLQRAEALWAQIVRSKLTHPNPWAYTPKARIWAQQAEQIVDDLARGRDLEAAGRTLATLIAEVEADRDFQEARQAF